MFSSKFVRATDTYCTYQVPVSAPLMRKSFDLASVTSKCSLTLTCTGFYRLWVNGEEITSSRLAPGITNPDQILIYDTYCLDGLVHEGKNVLAFMLGNGMSDSMGGYIWDFDKALFRSAPKLAFSLEAGNELLFEADTDIRCTASPVYYDDLRSGEFYDARQEIPGWTAIDFDDSSWAAVKKTEAPSGWARSNTADPVKIITEYRAEKIIPGRIVYGNMDIMRPDSLLISKETFYKPDADETGMVFCFRENRACVPKLTIKGHNGQRIVIQASEYCSKTGEVDFSGIQSFYPFGFAQRDIYICKGNETETYIPSFTYHGARYFIVLGLEPDQVSPDLLTMCVMNSALPERGGFTCSDDVANALIHASHNSDLSNFVWFPTDCPHREKNGWTGDAAMSAEHMMQTVAPEKSWNQWLRMICSAQLQDGSIPGIVPTAGWGYAWGSGPSWDQVLTELPYQAYLYRGDLSLFKTVADSVLRYLRYASSNRDARGLLAYGLGDWCHALRESDDPLCPLFVSDTAAIYRMCTNAALLFEKIGCTLDAQYASGFGKQLRTAFRKYLIDFNTMTVSGSCQCAQANAIYYGFLDPAEESIAYRRLIEMIHDANDHFDCGMIGVRILFRTLAKHGDAELAWKMIMQNDAPGYGLWITKEDLTALPETFERGYDGCGVSLNHHFMGDFTGFFIAHVAGLQINPHCTASDEVRVQPNFISALTEASAWYETTAGKITVCWQRKGEEITLSVEKADGVRGEVVLPYGYSFVSIPECNPVMARGHRTAKLVNGIYHIEKA